MYVIIFILVSYLLYPKGEILTSTVTTEFEDGSVVAGIEVCEAFIVFDGVVKDLVGPIKSKFGIGNKHSF